MREGREDAAKPEPALRLRRRVSPRSVALLLALVVLVAAGLVVRHRLAPKHLLTVTPGVLYRSASLPPEQLAEVLDRYGIRTVVNLRSRLENAKGGWHAVQSALLAERHVALVDLPMDTGHPPSPEVLSAWLALLDDPARQPILVHCEYGVVRTGMMVSVYEIEHLGRSPEEVWRDFELFRGDLREPVRGRVRDFVEGYRTHGEQHAPGS